MEGSWGGGGGGGRKDYAPEACRAVNGGGKLGISHLMSCCLLSTSNPHVPPRHAPMCSTVPLVPLLSLAPRVPITLRDPSTSSSTTVRWEAAFGAGPRGVSRGRQERVRRASCTPAIPISTPSWDIVYRNPHPKEGSILAAGHTCP